MPSNHQNPLSSNASAAFAFSAGVPELSLSEFRELAELLGQQLGFRFPDSKQRLLAARLATRLRDLGLHSYHDYWLILQRQEEKTELQHAIDLVTTNETFFFREPQHFEFLQQKLLPPFVMS